MLATAKVSRPPTLNRRRRVRQKVHVPAYASFVGSSKGGMIDLYEVLNLSEVGVAIQCPAQLQANQPVNLCLDLAESGEQITSAARVIWSDSEGRAGLSIPPLQDPDLHRLREWLLLNALAGAANSSFELEPAAVSAAEAELRPNYTDILNAAHAVQREAESLGADLQAVLDLIASRSQSLLRASGAAIALASDDPAAMVCRASAGESAPPAGAVLQVGSGFSGECVQAGTLLRCDDTEIDLRVKRESCRALNIRAMLAAPIKQTEKVVGLLEVFSGAPNAFSENDGAVLQRFADAIASAIDRTTKKIESPPPFATPAGSVLFAQAPEKPPEAPEPKETSADEDADKVGGIRLPRAHLYLLMCAAATIFLALGFITAPSIQPWVQAKFHTHASSGEDTVLASGPAVESPKADSAPSVDAANLDQLRQMAEQGDAAAGDRLGRLYAEGDEKLGIAIDDKQADHWFTSAAEHGSVSAQYKLGLLYWGGHHGLPKDVNKAYFWAVLARAGGQEGSKDLAGFIANGLTRAQAAAIEQQAELWYRQHEPQAKPNAGR
jgi:putative methionine-R-sulfoxide reductase with GAF domain